MCAPEHGLSSRSSATLRAVRDPAVWAGRSVHSHDGRRIHRSSPLRGLKPHPILAEFTQHIPPKGSHLIRYYGWYSNKSRGMRKKAAAEAIGRVVQRRRDTGVPRTSRCSQTWAMLIKRVYEIDPLACPRCGGQMKVVAFIEPPQGDVIEKILRHCGLWHSSAPRAPPAGDGSVHAPDALRTARPGFRRAPELTSWIHQLPLVRLSPVGKINIPISWIVRRVQKWVTTSYLEFWRATGRPALSRSGTAIASLNCCPMEFQRRTIH